MIKNVTVHLANELPVMVDLLEAPAPSAQSVRCTNVRTIDGKRPSFVHDKSSMFVFPWHQIRLIEIPAEAAVQQSPQPDARFVPPAQSTHRGHPAQPARQASPPPAGALVPVPNQDEFGPPPDEESEEQLLARILSV